MSDEQEYTIYESASSSGRRRGSKKNSEYSYKVTKEELCAQLGLDPADVAVATLDEDEVRFVCAMLECELDSTRAWRQVRPGQELTLEQRRKIRLLLQRDDVKQTLRKAVTRHMSNVLDNLDSKLLDTYFTRAFYDVADYHDSNGNCLPLALIPVEKRVAIDRVETRYYGKDGDVMGVNYILANREKALDTLREYMAKVRPDEHISVTGTVAKESDLQSEIASMTDEQLQEELERLTQTEVQKQVEGTA